jgi:hypothetical protein
MQRRRREKERIVVKIFVIAIATTGTLFLSRIASATELPSYEAMGFSITPHQISVLGSLKVKEHSPGTYENLAKPADSRPDSKQLR